MKVKRIPMTHGMEIEQFLPDIPDEIIDDREGKYWGVWSCDYDMVYETQIGPTKYTNSLIKEFLNTARQYDRVPWRWTTSHGRLAAGSHVHSHLEKHGDFDESVKAWTITYNTFIDVVPFLAPFFCHDWRRGFREGSMYDPGRLGVERYASPNITRKKQSTIRQHYRHEDGDGRHESVTFKGSRAGKPLTIEVRMVDSHPVFALTGTYILRNIVKRCLERDLSVKVADRGIMDSMYQSIYKLPSNNNLLGVMQNEPVSFDRGIPDIDQDVDTMWEVLDQILSEYLPDSGTVQRKAADLVRASGKLAEMREFDPHVSRRKEIPDPASLHPAVWHVDDPDFKWPVELSDASVAEGEELFS